MSRKVGISLPADHAQWLRQVKNASKYVQGALAWRISRYRGATVFLKRLDAALVRKAIKELDGFDWTWYPEPELIAERLAAADGDEEWAEFCEAVKTMPKLAYALEAVAREVYSQNRKALELV